GPKGGFPVHLAAAGQKAAVVVTGDGVGMGVLEGRRFKEKDFARHHSSGSIGRALLLKVRDIMRADGRHAVAYETTPVKEALLLMTRAKCGSVSVVNSQGKLIGVFTDGDLRRHMAHDSEVLMQSLRSVMTARPICVREDALAVEALRIFNQRSIDDLIVVNSKNQPVGLVDSQDLPKLKLM